VAVLLWVARLVDVPPVEVALPPFAVAGPVPEAVCVPPSALVMLP
jgi:hypothetical protein